MSPTMACLFLSISLYVFQQHPSAPALIHLLIFTQSAVPPQEPGVPWQPEAFRLPGGRPDAGEAIGIWVGKPPAWPDI